MTQPIYDARQGGYRVFIGNLSSRTDPSDLRKECERHGQLVDCWVARNPPGFAFILYKHGQDAEAAVKSMDGQIIGGQRIRVEHARARSINPRSKSHRSRSRSKKRSSRHRSRSSSSSSSSDDERERRRRRHKSSRKKKHRRRKSSERSSRSHSKEKKSPSSSPGE